MITRVKDTNLQAQAGLVGRRPSCLPQQPRIDLIALIKISSSCHHQEEEAQDGSNACSSAAQENIGTTCLVEQVNRTLGAGLRIKTSTLK